MGASFSLAVGGTTITLSNLSVSPPLLGKDRKVVENVTEDGTLFQDIVFNKLRHSLIVNAVSKTDADNINGWWSAGTTITYTPDTANSGTTYSVKIINSEIPLGWMPDTVADSFFEGTIQVRQI